MRLEWIISDVCAEIKHSRSRYEQIRPEWEIPESINLIYIGWSCQMRAAQTIADVCNITMGFDVFHTRTTSASLKLLERSVISILRDITSIGHV